MKPAGVRPAQWIPLTRPWMDEREADAARRAILSGWVTQGPEVAAFEREFAAAVSAPHACAVASCTAALHVALTALGVGPGDEVVTVSHSFIATANAVRYCGAIPVFVDVESQTFNIDREAVAGALSPKTKAILCVHQLGMPCNLEALLDVGRRRGIPIVEDAACAIGSEIRWNGEWQRIGRAHADIACFSLHPRKVITTGDGGMLTTRDAALDAQFRLLRQHGMSVPDTVRHESADVVFESYPLPGFNYRMTDIQAVDQRAVMRSMLDAGVATRRGVMCAHREAAYPPGTWRAGGALSASERLQDRGLILPLYHDMTTDDQDAVVAALRIACGVVA